MCCVRQIHSLLLFTIQSSARAEDLLKSLCWYCLPWEQKIIIFVIYAWSKFLLIELLLFSRAVCARCDLVLFQSFDTRVKFDVALCLVLFIWFPCLATGPAHSCQCENLPPVWQQSLCLGHTEQSSDAQPLPEMLLTEIPNQPLVQKDLSAYFLFLVLFLWN